MENHDLQRISKELIWQNTGRIINQIRPARGILEIQRINVEVNLTVRG
jgi:hypothetical protein